MKTRHWIPKQGYDFTLPFALNPIPAEDGGWIASNGTTKGLKMPESGYFFDGEAFDFWEEEEDSVIARYAKEAERIYKETDKFTMYIGYGIYFMGDLEFICDLMVEPEIAREKIKWLHEWNFRHFNKLLNACGDFIQGICIGGDLGVQNAPMLDPKLYEAEIHPYVKEFCDHVHKNSDYKIFLHSCGAVRDFIPYMIEEGIDVLNPVQVSAAGMEPEKLKKDFGDKICFWGGGCDTQYVLNMGTSQEVKENTKKLVNIFKKNSGFVFNQVHNILGDIKPENIVTMLDTAYENSFF